MGHETRRHIKFVIGYPHSIDQLNGPFNPAITETFLDQDGRPAIAGCGHEWGRIAHLKVLKEDDATSMPDDSAAQITDPWRADILWSGGCLRSHQRSDDSLSLTTRSSNHRLRIGDLSGNHVCVHGTGGNPVPCTHTREGTACHTREGVTRWLAGVVMNISARIISVHFIRIHFGYAPGTHIQNAL